MHDLSRGLTEVVDLRGFESRSALVRLSFRVRPLCPQLYIVVLSLSNVLRINVARSRHIIPG